MTLCVYWNEMGSSGNQALLLIYSNYKDDKIGCKLVRMYTNLTIIGQSTAVGSNRIACYLGPKNN